ncbi:MAG: hypothetical protein IKR48_01710 [Kiritimatiellae bacterium]|nr:hypothetical protein [Kiritimatiellia bacterium]
MKKIRMLGLFVVGLALPLFGDSVHDPAINIDGGKAAIEKWRILNAAEGIMRLQNTMDGLDKKVEQQILRDVFLDFESWLLAMAEVAGRGLQFKELGKAELSAFAAKSPYGKLGDDVVLRIAFEGSVASQRLLELDHVDVGAHNGRVRELILARYRSRHNVEITDYSVWKVDRNRFNLIKDSQYNALEHELDEDSWTLTKAIYYIHHYTIRYYVLLLRWYIGKAEALVKYAKEEKWSESTTRWVSRTVLYVIPYLFHVILVCIFIKCNGGEIRIFATLLLALLLSGVSTILFYFGMSPWSLFVVCVGVPLGLYLAPTVWDTMSRGGSNCSGGGYSYASSGGASASSGRGEVPFVTTITDENGCEYKGEGENPETIEKQTPGDYAIFDRRIDGSYRERFGDRVIEESIYTIKTKE